MSETIGASQQFFMLSLFSLLLCRAIAGPSGQRFLSVRDHSNNPVERGPADLLMDMEKLANSTDFDHVAVVSARMPRLEAALMPLYRISPKDAHGNLNVKAARYVLHRLFAQRHGWFVNGIGLHEGFSGTSRVGEALFSGSSYSIKQLAHFAAVVETLAHSENVERLQQAFEAFGHSRRDPYDADKAQVVLNGYMAQFLTIVNNGLSFQERVELCESVMVEWTDTKLFVHEILQKVIEEEDMSSQKVSMWDVCLKVVDEVGERYGRWQDTGCNRLKSKLSEMETPGTGRVPLTKFWSGRAEGQFQWPFIETIQYLEQLGAIDDNELPQQSVLIANYVQSATNCMAGSKYYDVCCLNECERILEQIEIQIDAPTASPRRLLDLVSKLPSSTVQAPRVLPASLTQRLELIAEQNDGNVILHGRLFAQFLHHAFPRECPYPYLSGSKRVESEWKKRMSNGTTLNRDEAAAFIEWANSVSPASDVPSELPWTDEEDLFMHDLLGNEVAETNTKVPFIVMLVVGCAVAVRFWQPLIRILGLGGKASNTGYYV
eukprot:TRINITY_DN27789_c0_g1_i1.p1 TRINITY_DN27789_c0_g1~~TRINITY_DN27789_c0_g1_i1.p1  ORF type:complete len:547 (+),score=97.18 TRINITY_DN27789_c0_g1_i1:82-1722(+)